jgi:hypothetical protein
MQQPISRNHISVNGENFLPMLRHINPTFLFYL